MWWARLFAFGLVAMALGCSRRHEPAPAGPPLDGLTYVVDGKRVPLRAAFAHSARPHTLTITLATFPWTCAEAVKTGYTYGAGERVLKLELEEQLFPDGKLGWRIDTAWDRGIGARRMVTPPDGGIPSFEDIGQVSVASDDPHGTVRMRVRAEWGPDAAVEGVRSLSGDLAATGCGLADAAKDLPPPLDIAIDVAGRRMPIRDVTLQTHGDDVVVTLASEPAGDCHSVVSFELELRLERPTTRVRAVYLRGRLFPTQRGTFYPPGTTESPFRVEAPNGLTPGSPVPLRVHGSGRIHDHYDTSANADVIARWCPPSEPPGAASADARP